MKRNLMKTIIILAALLIGIQLCTSALASDDGMLRIRLTRVGTVDSVTLRTDCPYTISETGTTLPAGSMIEVSVQNSTLNMRMEDSELASGTSLTLLRGGSDSTGLSFVDPNLSHVYCGDLNLTASGSVITPILTIYIEDYICGVVADALPESAGIEALKAEAIAARSYALCKRAAAAGTAYDLTDSSSDQTFTGRDITRMDAAAAAEATAGKVLYANGKVAACYTTRSNGGQIETAENVWGTKLSYSKSQTDSYDAESPDAANKSVVLKKDGSNINTQLRAALLEGVYSQLETWGLSTSDNDIKITSIDSIKGIDPKFADGDQYRTLTFSLSVQSVNLSTGKPVRCSANVNVPTYTGIENWYDLSINDTDNETITVVPGQDEYKIMFRREGHGIGLSLNGARVMAETYNKPCEEILKFYYPGTDLHEDTLTRADTGSVAAAVTAEAVPATKSTSIFALPTLVPIAMDIPEVPSADPIEQDPLTAVAPTVEPAPESTDMDVVFVDLSATREPEPTAIELETPAPEFSEADPFAPDATEMQAPADDANVPPLFKDLPSADPVINNFIAGSETADDIFMPDSEFMPESASTFPPSEIIPETDPLVLDDSADEYDLSNLDLPSDLGDIIDYAIDDSVLGALEPGSEEDHISGGDSLSSKDFDSIEDLDISGADKLISKNVSDEDILGPMEKGGEPGIDEIDLINDPLAGLPDDVMDDLPGTDEIDLTDDLLAGLPDESGNFAIDAAPASMKSVKEATYGVITTNDGSSLWLRSAPSTDSETLGYILCGDVVRVYKYNSTWLAVATRDGTKGYVARSYVTRVSESQAKQAWQQAQIQEEDTAMPGAFEDLDSKNYEIVICDFSAVTTANVRLHESADVDSFTLVTVAAGETVEVTAYNDVWAFVEYQGMEGFISRDYLKKG